MKEGLSTNYNSITCEDVVVTYTPSSNVTSYSYIIIKDNVSGQTYNVDNNQSTTLTFTETGTYKVVISEIDNLGNTNVITSTEYKIDKEAPIINIKEETYKLSSKDEFNYMEGVTATDAIDGDLTSKITTNFDSLDLSKEGIKELTYQVSDTAGNITTQTLYLTVTKDNTNLIRLGQVSIIFILFLVFVFLNKYIRSIKLEKRFSKYTINSSKNSSISLLDNLYNQYRKFINKLSKALSKSSFLKKRSIRYRKYIEAFEKDEDEMTFMARKVVVGFIYILVAILVKLVESKLMQPLEMLIPFIIGFYTLDLIYMYKYARYRKKIESNLLEAITVMNNSFKAGMSIMQAVDLVSRELDGPISKEFKKIGIELSLGIDVEDAFKRFAERIKIKEAVYLTSSLSVLNKTGGNIIKVFDSIEKNIFNKKKLEHELKSLTSSSKLIMWVLICVPIIFIAFISMINKDYFTPLFTNPLGLVLVGIMLVIYITYIIVVRRVMKVRM